MHRPRHRAVEQGGRIFQRDARATALCILGCRTAEAQMSSPESLSFLAYFVGSARRSDSVLRYSLN
jgi:hypothetical protein